MVTITIADHETGEVHVLSGETAVLFLEKEESVLVHAVGTGGGDEESVCDMLRHVQEQLEVYATDPSFLN